MTLYYAHNVVNRIVMRSVRHVGPARIFPPVKECGGWDSSPTSREETYPRLRCVE